MAITFDDAADWLADHLHLVDSRREKFVRDMARCTWSPSDKQVEFLLDLYEEAKRRESASS
jgi:hypothetical protein